PPGYYNVFDGGIPVELGKLIHLVHLDLSSCGLGGRIPHEIGYLINLDTLFLHTNRLSGPVPSSLGNLTRLVFLDLSNNELTGELPQQLAALTELSLLNLFMNWLHGPLPAFLALLPNLDTLQLFVNNFTGGVPEKLGGSGHIRVLDLSSNELTGTIPANLCSLSHAIKLDLSCNGLSGSIPPEIGNCTRLAYLDLSQNNLSGPIPPEIAGIGVLNYLNLSRNQLNGSIPRSVAAAMRSLTVADFSFNDLSGWLPDSGELAYLNVTSFSGNPKFCGPGSNNSCDSVAGAPRSGRSHGDFELALALALVLSCFALSLAAAAVRARSQRGGSDGATWRLAGFHQVDFGVSDVLECMKEGNVVGRGGAGVLYRGRARARGDIAVKRLVRPGSNGHDRGLDTEIQTLGSIQHRNIVPLLAVCYISGETNALVYGYMSNGSLGAAARRRGQAVGLEKTVQDSGGQGFMFRPR
ncbi:leucine-rich repeat receptor-like serine threonine-protein kinase BAM1-like, partial [Musa troglodytarum]